MEQTKLDKYLTPLSLVLGALLIAGAIYWGDGSTSARQPAPQAQDQAVDQEALDALAPITAEDHVRGSRNAEVFVVEYSDTECPFCKRFHSTMQQIMSKYEASGTVAWVYRHFPLDQLHAKARSEAVALECANELGGNDAFWKYADRLFEVTPSNDGLEASELPKIAAFVGLDTKAFAACQKSGRYDAHIEADAQNAQATGGQGTPWNIIVAKDGKKYPLSGAQPYEAVEQLIQTALQN